MDSGVVLDLAFASRTRGNTEANVKSTRPASVTAAKRLTNVNALRGIPVKMVLPCFARDPRKRGSFCVEVTRPIRGAIGRRLHPLSGRLNRRNGRPRDYE